MLRAPLARGLGSVEYAIWVPGSQTLLLSGYQGDQVRIYLQGIDGAPSKPISRPDFKIASDRLTRDGRYAVGRSVNKHYLVALSGGEQRIIPGLRRNDEIVAFSADSRGAYVQALDSLPARVDRLDLATGQRSNWRTFHPATLGGVIAMSAIFLTADLSGYAYSYESIVSDLYMLDGAI